MQSDIDALTELNLKIGAAESEGDQRALDALLAPVLAFRRANGDFVGRSDFLAGVKPSPRRETEIESISLLGRDRAMVTCVVTVHGDGEARSFQNARLFVRSDGVWKLLGWANEPA